MARGKLIDDAMRKAIIDSFKNTQDIKATALACGTSRWSVLKVMRATGAYVSAKRAPRADKGKVRGPYNKVQPQPREAYRPKYEPSGFITPLTPQQMMVKRA